MGTTVQTAVKTTATIRSLVAAMMIKIKIRVSSVRRVLRVREVLLVRKDQEAPSVRKGQEVLSVPKDKEAKRGYPVRKDLSARKDLRDSPEACSATLIFTP